MTRLRLNHEGDQFISDSTMPFVEMKRPDEGREATTGKGFMYLSITSSNALSLRPLLSLYRTLAAIKLQL